MTRFMISSKNAEILYKKNKTLLLEEKEEELQFLKRLENNQAASLGPLDRNRLMRFQKNASKYQRKVTNCAKYLNETIQI